MDYFTEGVNETCKYSRERERKMKYKDDGKQQEKMYKEEERKKTLREGDHELGWEARWERGEGERYRKRKCGRKGRIVGREVRWERNMGRKRRRLEWEETERYEKGKEEEGT